MSPNSEHRNSEEVWVILDKLLTRHEKLSVVRSDATSPALIQLTKQIAAYSVEYASALQTEYESCS